MRRDDMVRSFFKIERGFTSFNSNRSVVGWGLFLCILGVGCYEDPPSELPVCFLNGEEINQPLLFGEDEITSNFCCTQDVECVDQFKQAIMEGQLRVKSEIVNNFSSCKPIEDKNYGYCHLGISQLNIQCKQDRDCNMDEGELCVVESGDVCRDALESLPMNTQRCALCVNQSNQ